MPAQPENPPSELFLYLTTQGRNSGKPREIEIWFTQRDGRFYVIAEYPTSQWVQNLQANPQVRVRVGKQEFPAIARFLSAETDASLKLAIEQLSREKYGWGDGLIVEVTPQSGVEPQP